MPLLKRVLRALPLLLLSPVLMAISVAVLALTGVLATLAPALRAARVDPVIAFRIDQ